MKLRLFSILFMILTLAVLLLQAFHPAWRHHLQVDIAGQYISHARHFLTDRNLGNIGYNEYQPGAVLFFAALSPILLLTDNFEHFLWVLFAANILLILLNAYYMRKISGDLGVIIYSAILFFTGPITFYRFELLVHLFVLTSLFAWIRGRQTFSIFLLSVATFIKIYPALLLPYLIILLLKQKKWRQSFKIGSTFVICLVFLFVAYSLIFRVPASNIRDSLAIHSKKPVHVESVWATGLTILPKFTSGQFATGQGNWGIFGVSPKNTPGPTVFYNYFWVLPLATLYLWLLKTLKRDSIVDFRIILLIPLLFLIFSKILTPQYLLWFALLFPLIQPKNPTQWQGWTLNLFFILLAAFLSQYVYPLQYDQLLGSFYHDGASVGIFWVLAARNTILIILSLRFLREALWSHT